MKALITGASSGIGRDMARYLSGLGYDLVIVARRENLLKALKNELKTNIEVEVVDVSIKESCVALYERHKDIDLLINNAGFGVFGEFTETDLDKELSLIDTNIKATHILTKLYVKNMKEKNRGRILNVTSIAGFMTGPLMSAYYASKNYVVELSSAINKELKKDDSEVRISILCPGPVETNFNNVAGVKFAVKALSSEYVAKYAIDKTLKGKEIIIPGTLIKILYFLNKLSPRAIATDIAYHSQKAKKK